MPHYVKKALIIFPFAALFLVLIVTQRFQSGTEGQPEYPDAAQQAEKIGQYTDAQEATIEHKDAEENATPATDTDVIDTVPIHLTPQESLAKTLDELRESIAKDRQPLNHPAVRSDPAYWEFREEMLLALEQDPSLLNELIDIFSQDINSHLSREIASVLSENGAPEVQTMALDIGLNGYHYDHAERTAALFVLVDMDAITPDTRDRLLDNLTTEQDIELLQFSMMAMRPSPSTQADYARVQETLNNVIDNENAHVRRHAAGQIASWATSSEDLEPLRAMAAVETDFNARAQAVLAVGQSPFKTEDNKAVLWNAVINDNERASLRWSAWEALQGYPLNDSELAEYEELGLRIEQAHIEQYGSLR